MKVLMCIFSPRNISVAIKAYDAIDYVDKYWIKYHTEKEALGAAERFFKEHTEYTHLIIAVDDTVINYDCVAKLIADFEAYPKLEVISGVVGLNYFKRDNRLSVTIEPVVEGEIPISTYSDRIWRKKYKHLLFEFVSLQGLMQVWYDGFSITMMTRRVFELIGLKTWGESECMSDLKFAFDCWKSNISQYIDLRNFMWHYRRRFETDTEYEVLVNGKKGTLKYTQLILATVPIPEEEPAKILSERDLENSMKVYRKMYDNKKVKPWKK
jgi:hypothetical protein